MKKLFFAALLSAAAQLSFAAKGVNWIWVPSGSKDYDLARDDMLGRIEKLILSLPN